MKGIPSVRGSTPYSPPLDEKNSKNQPFLAIFWIFAPSETHFAPSMSPTKNFTGDKNKTSLLAMFVMVRSPYSWCVVHISA